MKTNKENISSHLPLYLLMVSYKRADSAVAIIQNFIKALRPNTKVEFLVVENSDKRILPDIFDFSSYLDITYSYFNNKNKAKAVNYAIENLVKEQNALIVHIDNDISFQENFLINYYTAALKKGEGYYFGSSFFVNNPKNYNRNLIPYLSGSAFGMPDKQFKKMKRLMFLGCSYAFFKSQWQKVNGLDERFSPGSKYRLGGEESIFQKKMVHAGFVPHFIKNNQVEHKTLPELYTFKNVMNRQQNNGYTHGFQNLIISSNIFKTDCIKRLLGLIKRCIILFFKNDNIKFKMKYAYTRGFFKAFILYFKINDTSSYLKY